MKRSASRGAAPPLSRATSAPTSKRASLGPAAEAAASIAALERSLARHRAELAASQEAASAADARTTFLLDEAAAEHDAALDVALRSAKDSAVLVLERCLGFCESSDGCGQR